MLGVIGGSGFYKLAGAEARREDTPYGLALVSRGRKLVFVPRHGEKHELPPHRVNHRANIYALKKAGATSILGINACGVIAKYKPGDTMTIDDFIAFHLGPITYFESFADEAHHTDMSEPYSHGLNAKIARAAKMAGVPIKSGGIVATSYGPRFETPAEIRAFRLLGANLISMTSAYEAILARELGVPYASIAIGTNYAAGISKRPLSHDEVIAGMKASEAKVMKIVGALEGLIL